MFNVPLCNYDEKMVAILFVEADLPLNNLTLFQFFKKWNGVAK
jgi:hypothetical protein